MPDCAGAAVREKGNLLNGICPEAAEVLKASRVSSGVFVALRKMKPVRQVEAAELMVAANNYTGRFAMALLTGTSDEMRVEPQREDRRYLNPAQRAHLAHETNALLRKAKVVEATYGTNALVLSVCLRYVEKILHNHALRDFLRKSKPDLLAELRGLVAGTRADAARTRRAYADASSATASG